MSEKIDFDYQRAGALLSIVQLVAGVAPQFTSISGEAMSELREMNDVLVKLGAERAERHKAEVAQKIAEQNAKALAQDETPKPVDPQLDLDPKPSEPVDHTKTAEDAKPHISRRSL